MKKFYFFFKKNKLEHVHLKPKKHLKNMVRFYGHDFFLVFPTIFEFSKMITNGNILRTICPQKFVEVKMVYI